MSLDIDLIDKSNFVCFQLKDESVYFGEIQYQDEEGRLYDQKQDPDAPNKGKPVRHGFGIQLFGTNPDNFLCKYEGYWEHDRQNGQCRIWFPDKAVYDGQIKNGIKEGFGKFCWPNGDQYEGNWRNNRFEGGGTFSHHDGTICKGLFKNNYYVQQGEIFINPFLSSEETEEFLRRRHEISQIKEKNKKQKLFFFEKCQSYQQCNELIKQSNQNGRIPIIFTSKQNDGKLNEVMTELQQTNGKNYYNFDLRKIYDKKITDKSHMDYLNSVKSDLSNVLAKGEAFIINLDESDCAYEEIFYPDIREFYKPQCFPTQIWEIEELRRYQVYEKIIANTDNQFAHDVHEDFNILVWSKFKINEELDNKVIIEKIERRFSTILPLIKLDFILITSKNENDQQQEQHIEEEEEPQQE